MKKLLIVLLSFIVVSTYAQSSRFNPTDVGRNFKGYCINDKHDTTRGSILLWLQFVMQAGCQMNDGNNKVINAGGSPHFNIYYEMENGLKWYSTKFTTLTPPADKKRVDSECFLHVMEAGPITLYDYNFYDQGATPEVNEVKTYIQLPDKKIIDISSMLLGFSKKMSEYVKDYPELAAKITAKEKGYGFTSINSIVREYNTWYMGKNPGFTIIEK
jgi:hypothetical protein